MSHFRPVELRHASRLLNHGPTVLITSRDETIDRRNVMAAAWSMPVELNPAYRDCGEQKRVVTGVDRTQREIRHCDPRRGGSQLDWAVGSVSGRDEDKFNCYGIPVIYGPELDLPVIEEKCLAWMECRLLPVTSAAEI